MNSTARRLISLIVGLFLLVYVGYQAYLMFYTSVTLETVNSYTVYETLDVQGIAIRDETIISDTASGYIYYTITNGDRVARGGTIANVYASESAALANQRIEEIDSQISSLETLQRQTAVNKTDIEALNNQIRSRQQSILQAVRDGDLTEAASGRERLLELLNRKQIVLGTVTDFSSRIAELTAQRTTLAGQVAGSQASITSPAAGYFVSSVDGYESTFDYSKVSELTVDQVEEAMSSSVQTTQTGIGKVVGDYVWYLACVVPQEKLSLIGNGQELEIKLPFVTDDTVPVTVVAINTDTESGKAMVLLECSYMSEELSSVRCEEVRILLKEYTGLYIPDEALQFTADNETGVYVRVGNVLAFRYIQVLYYDETGRYSICATEVDDDERSYVRLYDDMVVGGKGLYDGKVVA